MREFVGSFATIAVVSLVCADASAQELPTDVKGLVAGIEADLRNARRYLKKGDKGYVDYYLKNAAKYWKRIEAKPAVLEHATIKKVLADMNAVRSEAKLKPLGGAAPTPTAKPTPTPARDPVVKPTPPSKTPPTKPAPVIRKLPSSVKGHLMWLSRALADAERYVRKGDKGTARTKLNEAKGYFVKIHLAQAGALKHPKVKPARDRYAKLSKTAGYDTARINGDQNEIRANLGRSLDRYDAAIASGDADRAKQQLATAQKEATALRACLLPEQRGTPSAAKPLARLAKALGGTDSAQAEVATREERVKRTGANAVKLWTQTQAVWKRLRVVTERTILSDLGLKMNVAKTDQAVLEFESLWRQRAALLSEAEPTAAKVTEFRRQRAYAKFFTPDMRLKGEALTSLRRSHQIDFGQWLSQLLAASNNAKGTVDGAAKVAKTGGPPGHQSREYARALKGIATARICRRLLDTLLPAQGAEWTPPAHRRSAPATIRANAEHCLTQHVALAKANGENVAKEALRLRAARFPSKGLSESEYTALEPRALVLAAKAYKKKALRVRIAEPWRERHGWFRYGNQVEWEDFRYVGAWVALQEPKPKVAKVFFVTFRQMLSNGKPGPLEVWGISGGYEMLTENVSK